MQIKNVKRKISILLAFVLTLVFAISIVHIVEKNKVENNSNVEVSAAFSGGSGVADDPYLISSIGDFWTISFSGHNKRDYYKDKYFLLTIDLTIMDNDANLINIIEYDGIPFLLRYFAGNLNGNGYSITIKHENNGGYPYFGFSQFLSGRIYNLELSGFSFLASDPLQEGSLFVDNVGESVVENCLISDLIINVGTKDSYVSPFDVTGANNFYHSEGAIIKNCLIKNIKLNNPNNKTVTFRFNNYLGPATLPCKIECCVVTNSILLLSGTAKFKVANNTGLGVANCYYTNSDEYEDFGGLNINSIGGPYNAAESTARQGSIWYHGGIHYNNGYPVLRYFTKWNKLQLYIDNFFPVETEFACETKGVIVEDDSMGTNVVYIPRENKEVIVINHNQYITYSTGYYYKYTFTNSTFTVYNSPEIYVRPPVQGYRFTDIVFERSGNGSVTAHFEPIPWTLTFDTVSRVNDARIPNICPNKELGHSHSAANCKVDYTVLNGTEVKHTVNDGVLTYEFIDKNGVKQQVTYKIPKECQVLKINEYPPGEKHNAPGFNNNHPNGIVADTRIQPSIEMKKYSASISVYENEIKVRTELKIITYGDKIVTTINEELSNLVFKLYSYNNTLNESITVSASEKYAYEDISVKIGEIWLQNDDDINNYLKDLQADVEIKIYFVQMYEIKFVEAQDENGNKDKAQITSTNTVLNVKRGDGVYIQPTSKVGKTLTYSYKGISVEYEATAKYYVLMNTISLADIQSDMVVIPQAVYSPCVINMDKNDPNNIAVMTVQGDDYGTGNDGIFIVELGTRISFSVTNSSDGKFTYTYTFGFNGEIIVTYTIQDNQYALASELDEHDNRVWFTDLSEKHLTSIELSFPPSIDLIEEYSQKTITPTFELKRYSTSVG